MDYTNDFPMLKNNYIYFDNGATTLKPKIVIDKMNDYYFNYSSNAHRGDYDISLKVNNEYESVRKKVQHFINAKDEREIIFTSGATESLNEVIKGYLFEKLEENDEILTTKSEHASIILPLFDLENSKNVKVKYMDLNKDFTLTVDNVIKKINANTKAIIISHTSNVIGDTRDIKNIIKEAHKKNILVIIDASQSIGHQKIDVQDMDIDFLVFSAHKMLGPTGVGVLYGKYKYLNEVKPLKLGGGMNVSFNSPTQIEYNDLPYKLEAGTQNIAGIIGFGAAIDYINMIGIDNIHSRDKALKSYLINKLEKLNNIDIYNANIEGATVIFNVKGVFAQDTAIYLNKYNICVRSGSHCAKKLSDELGVSNTCRISLYFYNTYEEIDKLIDALDNKNILKESLGI